MAGRVLTDEKIKARKLYVEDGITSFSDLAAFVNVTRQTVAKWASDEDWEGQRTSYVVRPDNITDRMLHILQNYMAEIEELQAQKKPVSPMVLKQLRDMTSSIKSVKDDYDERGGVITMWKKLIAYLTSIGARDALKQLQAHAPGFFSYLEK